MAMLLVYNALHWDTELNISELEFIGVLKNRIVDKRTGSQGSSFLTEKSQPTRYLGWTWLYKETFMARCPSCCQPDEYMYI